MHIDLIIALIQTQTITMKNNGFFKSNHVKSNNQKLEVMVLIFRCLCMLMSDPYVTNALESLMATLFCWFRASVTV